MAMPTVRDVRPVNEFLSNLSVAYRQDQPAVSDRVFPRINVDAKSGSYFVWDKADTWRNEAAERAPGANFRRFDLRLSSDTYLARQYALEHLLPDEILANAADGLNLEETAMQAVVDELNLQKDLKFAADFMTTAAGWGTGTASAKWSTTSTPIANVRSAARTIMQTLGSSNSHRLVGIGGRIVFDALTANADITGKLTNVMVGTIANVEGAIAGILGLDEIIIVDRMYTTSKQGQTAAYAPVFDDDFLVVAVPRNPGQGVASAGYTLAWNEGGRGDQYIETYRDEIHKSDVVRGITHYDMKQVAAGLGVLWTDVVD